MRKNLSRCTVCPIRIIGRVTYWDLRGRLVQSRVLTYGRPASSRAGMEGKVWYRALCPCGDSLARIFNCERAFRSPEASLPSMRRCCVDGVKLASLFISVNSTAVLFANYFGGGIEGKKKPAHGGLVEGSGLALQDGCHSSTRRDAFTIAPTGCICVTSVSARVRGGCASFTLSSRTSPSL